MDGQRVSAPLALDLAGSRIAAEAASLVNDGGESANVVVGVSGRPIRPEPAGGNGYQITREYYDLDGNRVDPADVALNTRIVVVLNVTSDRIGRGRLLVVDRLPAGLVIDNPRLVRGGDLGGLDWLDPVDNTEHAEFRDDRFAVAIDQTRLNADGYTFAYLARAALPGRFALPPATVEDMYRPHMSATTATGRFEVRAP
jgi:hypothetical protein